MDYEEIMNAIYMQLIIKPGVDMCGPKSDKAILALNTLLEQQMPAEQQNDMDIEGLVSDGFAENAENGFYHGFQCAVTLLTGTKFPQ